MNPLPRDLVQAIQKLPDTQTDAFDLFARAFQLLDVPSVFPCLIEIECTDTGSLSADIASWSQRIQPELPSLNQAYRESLVSAMKSDSDLSVLRHALSIVLCIDAACAGLRIADHWSGVRRVGHLLAMLSRHGKLNLKSPGRVIRRGTLISAGNHPILRRLQNLTFFPDGEGFPKVDYATIPDKYAPVKCWREPWKVGFVSAVRQAGDMAIARRQIDSGCSYQVYPRHGCHERLGRQVVGAIEKLRLQGADLVLLPECSTNTEIYEAVLQYMKALPLGDPLLVMVGTRSHEHGAGVPSNRATAICGGGRYSWYQDKLHPYAIGADTATKWGINEDLQLTAGQFAREHMAPEEMRLVVRDCSLGRLMILVCQDFSESGQIRPLIERINPTHVLVPVLDAPLHDRRWHSKEASDFEAVSSAVFVANSLYIHARQGAAGHVNYGFISVPSFPSHSRRGGGVKEFVGKRNQDYILWEEKSK